jgi:DNA segregation ATPase FtsK/SpoIIIE, S-DNA-T family
MWKNLFMSKKNGKNNKETYYRRSRVRKEIKYNVIAIIFFALGVIALLSFTGINDAFGLRILLLTKILFGQMHFLFPVFLFGIGLSLMAKTPYSLEGETKPYWRAITLGSFLVFFLSFLSLVHLIFYHADIAGAAQNYLGGGYLGLLLALPLAGLTGPITAGVIILALMIISALFIFNTSLEAFFFKISNTLRAFFSYYKFLAQTEKKNRPIEAQNFNGNTNKNGKSSLPSFKLKSLKTSGGNEKDEAEKESAMNNLEAGAKGSDSAVKAADLDLKKHPKIRTQWHKFPLDLLEGDFSDADSGDISANASIIERTLANFGIEVEMGKVYIGPTVTQYTLKPAVGVKLSRITALQNDLALSLAASSVRIEAPIPGKSLVGIEIPNVKAATVRLKNLLETFSTYYTNDYYASLKVVMGLDVSGSPYWVDFTELPHLLIAGSTGSGKTIFINNVIMSLIYNNSPEVLKLIMIDPKRVELTLYNSVPHLLTPVIVENEKAVGVLKWAVGEMERRYVVLQEAGSRDIDSYNKKMLSSKSEETEPLPYIAVIVDELADLMATFPREVEAAIVRLAQMSRAVGIHLIISTQRPSVNVITGLIKANITARVAFRVASLIDSRTILDHSGAEKLLGRGDMLYLATGTAKPKRLQGCFVSEGEVKKVTRWLKENYASDSEMLDETAIASAPPSSIELSAGNSDAGGDEMYEQAKEVVLKARKASASLLQRRLRVGYARAARLLDLLEEQGIIGPADGAKPRAILAADATLGTLPSGEGEMEENINL